jgi:hypothetical protein
VTTGGSTSGKSTSALRSARPKKRVRVRSMAMAMPKGRLAAVASAATRKESLIASSSSGVSVSKRS